MAIQIDDIEPRRSYDVGGVSQAVFTIPFLFFDVADIRCSVAGVELEGGFTVTGAGQSSGGTLTLAVPVSNTVVMVWRDVAIKRASQFPASGPFKMEALNTDLNKQVAVSQQLADRLGRSIRIPDAERTVVTAIPSAATRARKSLVFDNDGNVTVSTFDHEQQAQFPVQAAASAADAAAAKMGAEQARDQAATIRDQTSAVALGDFIQSGVGAVLRPVVSKLRDTLSVLDFGAVGDGVTDNTVAFQKAWNAAKARGKAAIHVPAGIYVLAGTVISDASNVSMVGDGRKATHIYKGSSSGDLFTLTGSFLTIRDMMMESPLGHTGGYYLNFNSAGGNHRVENVDTYRGWSGVYFGGAQSQIRGCILNQLAFNGVVFGPNNGLCVASDCSLFGLATNTGAGFKFLGGDTFQLNNIQVTSHKNGYLLQPPAGGFLYNVFAVNCFADGVDMSTPGGDGWVLDASAAGSTIRRTRLFGCWGSAMTRDGMRIVGAVEDTEIWGAVCVTNVGHGLNIIGSPTPKGTRIFGGLYSGNSAPNFGNPTNVYSGIYIGDYVNDFTIFHAHCGPTDTIANTQRYGFEIHGVNHDNYQHGFNDVRGNLTDRYLDEGSGTYRQNFGNIGDAVTGATGGNYVIQSKTGEVQFRGTDGSAQVGIGTAVGSTLRLLLKGSSPGGNAVIAMAGTGNGNIALYPSGAGYGVLLDAQRASWVAAIGGAAGTSPVLTSQSYVDADVDFTIAPQGNGNVRFGGALPTTVSNPSAFEANRKLAIKDKNGTVFYVAGSYTPW